MIAGESTEKEAQRKEKNMGKAKKKKKKNRLTVIEAQLSGFNEVICQRAGLLQKLSNKTSENNPVSILHSSTGEKGVLKGLRQESNVPSLLSLVTSQNHCGPNQLVQNATQ